MFKKVKKILLIITVVQIVLGIFMGLLFILDKLGKIDLEQLGILTSGGYGTDFGNVSVDLQQLLQLSDNEVWALLTGVGQWKPEVGEAVMSSRMTTITVPIRTAEGDTKVNVTVNKVLAELFTGFFTDLYNYCPDFYIYHNGYYDVGGYNYRPVNKGYKLSAHAFGAAVDINSHYNPDGGVPPKSKPSGDSAHYVIYDDPSNPVLQIAKKYSLCWGGWFSGSGDKDGMHFSFTGDWTREKTRSFYESW